MARKFDGKNAEMKLVGETSKSARLAQPALITGAAAGMGRAIALAVAADGHDVAIHYRSSQAAAEDVAEEARAFGVRALTINADLTVPAQALGAIERSVEALGGLQILVNVVGNYHVAPVDVFPFDQWHDMFNSNLHASFYTCSAALPHLRANGGGRIVNFGFAGSQHQKACTLTTAYSIAKIGVTMLTKAIAEQEAINSITANVVAPGVIETSVSKPIDKIPMRRLGRVNEVVAAVRYFLSPEADYVTGQTIEVAGGWQL
jgi:3-oxoacyl-[acyl-carrier protein] reductase